MSASPSSVATRRSTRRQTVLPEGRDRCLRPCVVFFENRLVSIVEIVGSARARLFPGAKTVGVIPGGEQGAEGGHAVFGVPDRVLMKKHVLCRPFFENSNLDRFSKFQLINQKTYRR